MSSCHDILIMISTAEAGKWTTDADYRKLAEFRHHIERYLDFRDQAAKAAGPEPRQDPLLLVFLAI